MHFVKIKEAISFISNVSVFSVPENLYSSRCTRKPTLCICETRIVQFLFFVISSPYPASVAVQSGLCWTCRKARVLVFSRRGEFQASVPSTRIEISIGLNHQNITEKKNEPLHLKTINLCFQPGLVQTDLYSHRIRLGT